MTAIAAGGLKVLDSTSAGAPLADPALITDLSRRVLVRPDYVGTMLIVRMVYHANDVATSTVRIRVFGGMSDTETMWTVLQNLRRMESVDLETAASDVLGSTADNPRKKATRIDPTMTIWDTMGFTRFLIGIERIYAVSAGSAATAFLQAKLN
ncbi:MAG: hypothetical protein SGI86_03510 [Deltaproteobacteria bacterium]|nr:hypothetical protein [Deltaproteobacteria bacterium]